MGVAEERVKGTNKKGLWGSLVRVFSRDKTSGASGDVTRCESITTRNGSEEHVYETYGDTYEFRGGSEGGRCKVVAVNKRYYKKGKVMMKFKANYYQFNHGDYMFDATNESEGSGRVGSSRCGSSSISTSRSSRSSKSSRHSRLSK